MIICSIPAEFELSTDEYKSDTGDIVIYEDFNLDLDQRDTCVIMQTKSAHDIRKMNLILLSDKEDVITDFAFMPQKQQDAIDYKFCLSRMIAINGMRMSLLAHIEFNGQMPDYEFTRGSHDSTTETTVDLENMKMAADKYEEMPTLNKFAHFKAVDKNKWSFNGKATLFYKLFYMITNKTLLQIAYKIKLTWKEMNFSVVISISRF